MEDTTINAKFVEIVHKYTYILCKKRFLFGTIKNMERARNLEVIIDKVIHLMCTLFKKHTSNGGEGGVTDRQAQKCAQYDKGPYKFYLEVLVKSLAM